MIQLNKSSLKNTQEWVAMGVETPKFNYEEVCKNTHNAPTWVHFGAGNIFRGFTAALQQTLLNSGATDTGIIAAETFDFEVIDKIYAPHDNLSMLVIMRPDGSLDKSIIASITDGLVADTSRPADWARLEQVFASPSLQMCSFTITEKGYSLTNSAGELFPDVASDINEGLTAPRHVMSKVAALAYTRYKSGKLPIAFVSMDNCAHNGKRLHDAIETVIRGWISNKIVEPEFLDYISDGTKVAFPWSMIDKITPRPSESVKKSLEQSGFASTDIVCTTKNTYIAPFVNAEGPQYLVIEDLFPNKKPPLEQAGVIFASRDIVSKVEQMKVCTCLNPLHTALAVFGCLMGYELIADEMKNPSLEKLVKNIGYVEGLPVVVNPGVIDPKVFIDEVVTQRLPNPYIPDTPQRIATDTSQKVGIRFGGTIKAYHESKTLDATALVAIPLAIAGWCRYLLGVGDDGAAMAVSPDPMLAELQAHLSGVALGGGADGSCLRPILENSNIFGVDLYAVGLGKKVEGYFAEMTVGTGAVKRTLEKYMK